MTRANNHATEERRKSDLLIQAALLRDQGDVEQAASLFARGGGD